MKVVVKANNNMKRQIQQVTKFQKNMSGAQKKGEKETRGRLESAKLMRPLDNFFNKDTPILALKKLECLTTVQLFF